MVFSARLAREQGLPTNRQGVHRGGRGRRSRERCQREGRPTWHGSSACCLAHKGRGVRPALDSGQANVWILFLRQVRALAYETVAVALMEGFVQGIEGQDQGMDVGGTDFEVNCQATVSTVSCSPSCLVG